MDITSINLLKLLVERQKETSELPSLLGVKKRRLAYIIKDLGDRVVESVPHTGTSKVSNLHPASTEISSIRA